MNINELLSEGPVDNFKQGFQKGFSGSGSSTAPVAAKAAPTSPLSSVDPAEFKQILAAVINQQALTNAQMFTLKDLYRKL